MRALCGAIITAGALIGLGIVSIGIGARYDRANWGYDPDTGNFLGVRFSDLDAPFKIIMVLLIGALIVGLGIAILGLAYHHHRRYHEHLRAEREHSSGGGPRVTVG